MSETQIIEFTADQFASDTAPYEYLWSLQDDPFRQGQEVSRLERAAKALGVFNTFRRLWKAYQISMDPNQAQKSTKITDFPGQKQAMKCGSYECDDNGVTTYDPMRGIVTICPHPILPTKRIVNLDTGECKAEIGFYRGKSWRYAIFEKSVLASAQKIVSLATWGIAVDSENAKQMVTYLSTMETLNYEDLPEVRSIGRLGWVKDYGFSPYVEGLLYDGGEQYRHAFEAVKQAGSLETWLGCVSEIRTGASVAARIMLASAFASVLVGPLNALPFITHCWSNVSGIGKTVSLMAAGSVWANPRQGEYLKTFNSTNVGIEMMAGFYGDLPLCMDELCLKDGRREQFDAMIYSYCEGVGRTRGSKNGGLQRTLSWHNCLISTGEEPLTSGNSKAGAVNRVLDIACGDTRIFKDARETVRILTTNYGHAGPAFIQSLSTPGAMDAVRAMQDGFFQQLEGLTTDKQRLSASIILAADAWAEATLFHDGRALTADEIAPYLQSESSTDVNQRAYDWLMDTISANPSRFSTLDNNGEYWGTIEEDCAYIIKSIFDRIMQGEGYNSVGFLQWAKGQRLLRTAGGKQERLTIVKRLPGGKTPARCVCIQMPSEEECNQGSGYTSGYTIVENCDIWDKH